MRFGFSLFLAGVCVAGSLLRAENVDPAGDGSQYGYSENTGWINAEPSGDGGFGVQVGDSELSGWMWAENTGWISLSCQNTLSCATEAYGVTNDGMGQLGGYAWSESVGWISFSCTNTSSCGASSYGVTIDSATGVFDGYAFGENVGWISLNCSNTSSCGTTSYRVRTAWSCDPLPSVPTTLPTLQLGRTDGVTALNWSVGAGATGTDIVSGSLGGLRTSGGDFSASTTACLGDNRTSTSTLDHGVSPPGGEWYLVRGQNCGGNGSYDGTTPPQSGSRDSEIAASGNACP
jgi:hypothetical protein